MKCNWPDAGCWDIMRVVKISQIMITRSHPMADVLLFFQVYKLQSLRTIKMSNNGPAQAHFPSQP